MIDIINTQTVFSIITVLFLCGIVYNGVATYHESRGSSKKEKLCMYVLHFIVCSLSVKGYLAFLGFIDFSKVIG